MDYFHSIVSNSDIEFLCLVIDENGDFSYSIYVFQHVFKNKVIFKSISIAPYFNALSQPNSISCKKLIFLSDRKIENPFSKRDSIASQLIALNSSTHSLSFDAAAHCNQHTHTHQTKHHQTYTYTHTHTLTQ